MFRLLEMFGRSTIKQTPEPPSTEMQIENTKKENILVLSIDFDGCIFNDKYFDLDLDLKESERTIKANGLFLDYIVDKVKKGKYDRVVLMVGSNRQSRKIDFINCTKGCLPKFKTPSCYITIEDLRQELARRINIPCELETYLLSDSYGVKSPGSNFESCLYGRFNECNGFMWDSLKISLLYAQMSRVVTKYKNADIDFRFFDDKEEEILPVLAKFYFENKLFVPKNLSLSLHGYNGKYLLNHYFPDGFPYLDGLGPKDNNFSANILTLAACCYPPPQPPNCLDNSKYDISRVIYKDFNINNVIVDKFKHRRLLDESGVCTELRYEIDCLELINTNQKFSALIRLLNELYFILFPTDEDTQKSLSEEESTLARFALKLVREFTLSTKDLTNENTIDGFVKKYETQSTRSVNFQDSSKNSIAHFGFLANQDNTSLVDEQLSANQIASEIALTLKNLQEFQKKSQNCSHP